jgi:hypothetical protein
VAVFSVAVFPLWRVFVLWRFFCGGGKMQRILGVAVVALAALAVMELAALRSMRLEIARLRAESLTYALEPRREEIDRAGTWLHAWLQRPDGGSQPGGLCPDGTPDLEAIRKLVFGVYLSQRAGGASEAEAREAVIRNR